MRQQTKTGEIRATTILATTLPNARLRPFFPGRAPGTQRFDRSAARRRFLVNPPRDNGSVVATSLIPGRDPATSR